MIFGTKCPSIISMCSQSAPSLIVFEHSAPRSAKSAERIEGAMIAAGAIIATSQNVVWGVRASNLLK